MGVATSVSECEYACVYDNENGVVGLIMPAYLCRSSHTKYICHTTDQTKQANQPTKTNILRDNVGL